MARERVLRRADMTVPHRMEERMAMAVVAQNATPKIERGGLSTQVVWMAH